MNLEKYTSKKLVNESEIIECFDNLCNEKFNERLEILAVLKTKKHDLDIYRDLLILCGFILTLIGSKYTEHICGLVIGIVAVFLVFGVWTILFKERIRKNEALIEIIEASLKYKP